VLAALRPVAIVPLEPRNFHVSIILKCPHICIAFDNLDQVDRIETHKGLDHLPAFLNWRTF